MPIYNQIRTILAQKTIGIAGAGGLGSNCASSLLRSGIGKLIIADFDVVTEVNLNRQFYFFDQIGELKINALRNNLLRISPCASLQMHNIIISPENISLLFSTCDIVVEAFDLADQKQMLIEFMMENHPTIPVVAASGIAGWGGADKLKTIKCGSIYFCGNQTNEVSDENPPLAPKVNIVSNLQADVVLEILLGEIK